MMDPASQPRKPIEVLLYLAGIPCLVEGVQAGKSRLWNRIRSSRTGTELPPELLGLKGWHEVRLRAEAEVRGGPSLML